MPQRETIFFAKNYFHIYCRGNEKKDIFLDANDYERFLLKMKEYKGLHQISIICYCLMPNHFHLILRQNSKKSISTFMHRLTVSYSMYFNKRYSRVGHLFQGRFKAKLILKDVYLLQLSRYIHLNPLKSFFVISKLEKYLWSSYPEYLQIGKDDICEKEIILQQFDKNFPKGSYKKFVESQPDAIDPTGGKNFIIELD